MKTYQEIFDNALRKLKLSKKDVKDWKPAGDTYVPEIGEIKDAVVIWTYDGREILFREKGTKRFIEVDTTDTIGDLRFLRMFCIQKGVITNEFHDFTK